MVAITFALRDESRAFLPRLCHAGGDGVALLGTLEGGEVAVFHTGVGAARVRERLPRFLESHPVERLICAGYAGALDPALQAGDLVLADNFSDPVWLARARALPGFRVGRLVSMAEPVQTPEAKAALAARCGAAAVDQETEAIAALCRQRGVPVLALRAISDTARERLPVPFEVCFDAASERPRVAALLAYLARHLGQVRPFIRFAERVSRAREALARGVALQAAEATASPAEAGAPPHPGG